MVTISSDNETFKQGKETTDDLFLEKVGLLRVGQDGLPENQKLDLNLMVKDYSVVLGLHEKTIWAIFIISGIVFSSMVLTFV